MNKITIIGRLAKEPEYKTLQSGSTFCKFIVADNHKDKDGNEVADYFSCKSFGKSADFVGKYLTKGQKVAVFGRQITETWEKDGVKQYSQVVIVSEVESLESKKKQEEQEDLF